MGMLNVDENGNHVPYVPTYNDGRTKQSFKDLTDINKIVAKYQRTGTISHLANHSAEYGDFDNIDLLTAYGQLERANAIFSELPSEVRKEFDNTPAHFFEYVNDPANVGRLAELLPGLAEPGRQHTLNVGTPPPGPAVSKTPDEGPEKPVQDT